MTFIEVEARINDFEGSKAKGTIKTKEVTLKWRLEWMISFAMLKFWPICSKGT